MDSEENSYTAINQTYKIWKKNSPFLYSILQTYELSTCSQTVEWFPDEQVEGGWRVSNLLIGTNSLAQNALQVIAAGLPTDDSLTDYSSYREEKSEISVGANGFIGTLGQQQLTVKTSIPQTSEVMRARVNRFDKNLIAVKTGGANPEFTIYDLRNRDEELQNKSIALEGHTEEGFGLAWSPHQINKLLSGSYDRKILAYNIDNPKTPEGSWDGGEGVEDVKWSNYNHNIFASAHTDQKINIWDIRSSDEKPIITRKAHNGEVYSLDFNQKSEFLLLSGGEDGDVNLWDVRNMSKKLHTFIGHNDAVNVVSWCPHSAVQFATGSSDRRVILWDLEKLSDAPQKPGSGVKFIHGGHRSKVTDLSWNRQNEYLLSSCEQNNILQIWKMTDSLISNV